MITNDKLILNIIAIPVIIYNIILHMIFYYGYAESNFHKDLSKIFFIIDILVIISMILFNIFYK